MFKGYSNFIETKHTPLELSPKIIFQFESNFREYDWNILLYPVIWFVHPLSSTQLDPPEEYACKTMQNKLDLGPQLDLGPCMLVTRNLETQIDLGALKQLFHYCCFSKQSIKSNFVRVVDLWLISILVYSAPHRFIWLMLNLFLLRHLLFGISLIRNKICGLPIFAGSGTAALHRGTATLWCGTATVCAGWSVPILPFLSNLTHS
jgi:hypothetical protein